MIRLAHLVPHPIQYHAPLYRRIVAEADIDFTTFFQSDLSVGTHFDPGFGRQVQWDLPLLDGYEHLFFPSIGKREPITFWKPWTYGIGRALTEGKIDALWITGYLRPSYWSAIAAAKRRGIAVLIRDELHERSRERRAARRAAKHAFFA